MTATFDVKLNSDGIYQFSFVDAKGDTLMLSGEFCDRENTEQAIKDVRVGSLMSQQIAVANTPEGEKFFVIKDGSGQILVKSVLFNNEMQFNNALHSVRDSACVAEISYS